MTERKTPKIYFRIYPMQKMLWDYLKVLDDHKTIYVRNLQQLGVKAKLEAPTYFAFHSEHVFFHHNQKQIYDTIIPDILDNVVHNCDAIIMAYGQTGTGKSTTINGAYNPYENRGILPRITTDLLEALKSTKNVSLQVSYIEFTKMSVNDLLQPFPNHISSHKQATKVTVRTVENVLKLIFKGEGRKLFFEKASYASHSYTSAFTFHVDIKNGTLRTSRLIVVDFAGTNTVGNLSCLFKNPREVGAANLAKSQLEHFFLVLSTNIPAQIKVKLRLNPFIQFLGESLNRGTIFRAIGHIRVTREDLLVTLSMLRFGQLIGGVKTTKFNQITDATKEQVDNLQKELLRLRFETRYNSILTKRNLEKSLDEERFAHIERTVNEYLQNKITELSLVNVCDINIALNILKTICKQNEEKLQVCRSSSTKISKVSSSSQKGVQRSSKTSIKTGSYSEARISSADPKTSGSHDRSIGVINKRPKTSNASAAQRSSASGRKSRSIASGSERIEEMVPQVPPEYPEAWSAYTTENHEEYSRLIESYKKNNAAAKTTYKTYLEEVKNLKEISTRIDKLKNNLFLAKMTRDFNQTNKLDDGSKIIINEYEECCLKELQKAEPEKRDKQELLLRYQSELKAHINVCKDEKKTLNDRFIAFCKEKYQAPVAIEESSEIAQMTVEDTLVEEKAVEKEVKKETEGEIFERLKLIVEVEKKKRRLYDMKHRQWLTY